MASAVDTQPLPPTVTVVIGCHNQARYVEQCLDSVLESSWEMLEMLIVDDGSTDGSDVVIGEWLRRNSPPSHRYIRHDVSEGFTRRLNEASRLATGEYFAIVAADDVLLPDGIARRVVHLQQHPEQLAVFADSGVIDADGRRLFDSGIEGLHRREGMRRCHLRCERLIPYCVVFSWAVPGPVFLCRRSAFGKVGGYDERLVVEDWDMYLRLAAAGALGFVDAVVAEYRVHDASITRRMTERMLRDVAITAATNATRYRGIRRWYLRAHGRRAAGEGNRVRALLDRAVVGLTRRAYRLVLLGARLRC